MEPTASLTKGRDLSRLTRIGLFLAIFVGTAGACFSAGEPPKQPILRIEAGMHTAPIWAMSIDAQERYLVTVAPADKSARVWQLPEGRLLTVLRPPITPGGGEGSLYGAAISPDGSTVACGGITGFPWEGSYVVYLFDRESGRLLRRLTGLPGPINCLAYSKDGNFLAALMHKGGLVVYRTEDYSMAAKDSDYGLYSLMVAWDRHDRLVTVCYDGFVRLYAPDFTLKVKAKAPGGNQPRCVAFSLDGSKIVVGFNDSPRIAVLSGADLSHLYSQTTVEEPVISVCWSSDGAFLYAGNSGANGPYVIRKWDNEGRGRWSNLAIPGEAPYSARNPHTSFIPLKGGGILFATHRPSFGIIGRDDTVLLYKDSPIPYYRVARTSRGFLLSKGAEVLQVDFVTDDRLVRGRPIAKYTARLDAEHRHLDLKEYVEEDLEEDLYPPIQSAEALNITDWRASKEPKLNGVPLKGMDDRAFCYAICPDGRHFVLGGGGGLYYFDWEGKLKWRFSTRDVIRAVNVSRDGKVAVAAGDDGIIRWIAVESGKIILSFFLHSDLKHRILWTPEGYFDASPGSEGLVGYHINQGRDREGLFISFKQLYDVFYRPDIVTATVRGEDIGSLVTLTAEQALRNPPPQVSFTTVPPEGTPEKAKVCYRIVSTGGGIGEVRLFHNGKLLRSDGHYRHVAKASPKTVQLASRTGRAIYDEQRGLSGEEKIETPMVSIAKGETFEECTDVEPIPGENEVSLLAFNRDNTVYSYVETARFTSNRKADNPRLYILAVGINRFADPGSTLKYAAKDAVDFLHKMQAQSATLYRPEDIHAQILGDQEASKEKIMAAIDALSQVVRGTDEFVLFVASHGVLVQNQYFIVTHDYEGTLTSTHLISSNEIIEMSKKIRALTQLFVFDTCHAGGVDTVISGLYDARLSVLARKAGLHVYASANSFEQAIDGYRQNGLFTHTLLNGLNNEKAADTNGDNKVSIVELGEYAKGKTSEISTKLHHSQIPLIINVGKDSFVYALR